MKTTSKLNSAILSVAILFLSVVAFGQTNKVDNPPMKSPVKSSIGLNTDLVTNTVEPSPIVPSGASNGNLDSGDGGRVIPIGGQPTYEKASVEKGHEASAKSLYNYPNPFIESTNISFEVKGRAMVKLSIYFKNMLVTTLVNKRLNEGNYNTVFESEKLPVGTYLAVLVVDDQVMTRTMYKVR